MTIDRHPSDEQPIQDEDDLFVVDDGKDGLDDAFSAVEQEVARSKAARPEPAAEAEASESPRRPRAPADDLEIDDVDDVFVIADDGEEWLTGVAATPTDAPAPVAADPLAVDPSPATAQPIAAAADDAPLSIQMPADEALTEEDALFAAPKAVTPSESFIRSDVFRDAGSDTRRFGGHEMPPEEIGINTSEELTEEVESGMFGWEEETAGQELEIVDGASDATSELEDGAGEGVGDASYEHETSDAESMASEATAGDAQPDTYGAEQGEVEEFALVEGDPAEQFGIAPIQDDDVSAPASGVWAGSESAILRAANADGDDESQLREADGDASELTEEEVDPIYGEGAVAPAEASEPVEAAEPDYSEYEENYVASAQTQTPVVIGAPAARKRRGLAVFAMAALLFVGVGAGVAFMYPEWLGLDGGAPLIEKVAVSKPEVKIDIQAPVLPQADPQTQPPVDQPPPANDNEPKNPPQDQTGPGEQPTKSDTPPKTEPTPVEPPVAVEPKPQPDPKPDPAKDPNVTVDPTQTPQPTKVETPPVDPNKPPVDPTQNPTGEPVVVSSDPVVAQSDADEQVVRIGEDLQVGRASSPAGRSRVHHLAEGLVTGSQTFAQLKNMNYFLGRVKAMDSSFLTLDLAPGEVTLSFDDLNALVPLASDEYREMQGSAEGYVRLRNRNRLFGKVLNNSLADNVVLEVQKSQVVIPRATVEEVASSGRSGVQVPQEENADWIKAILQREAQTPKPPPSVTVPDRAATPPSTPPNDK